MDFTALNARITLTGQQDALRALGGIDAAAERAGARARAAFDNASVGLAGVGSKAGQAAEEVAVLGETANHMSHSAMIGVGELARGLGRIAETGQISAFSMRELSGSAMRLGSALGPMGGLAGIFVLLGGVIVETFMKARNELKKTQEEFDKRIEEMRRKAQGGAILDEARLLQGDFNEAKAALDALTPRVDAARKKMDELHQEVGRGSPLWKKAHNDWIDLSNQADTLATKIASATKQIKAAITAELGLRSSPAETGILPVVSTAQSAKGEESEFSKSLNRFKSELASFNKDMDRLDEERLHKAVSTQIEAVKQGEEETHRLAMKANEERDKSERDLFDFLLKIDKIWEENQRRIQQDLENRAREMGSAIANAIAAGIEGAFSRGGGLKNAFASATGALLSSLGDMAIRLGESSAAFMGFLKGILTAIGLGNPELGLAASIALIAFGSVLKSTGSHIASGGGSGGGSYASTYGAAGGLGSTIYVSPSPGASQSASSIQARPHITMNATIIGKDDPTAQRQILELIARAERRGTTSG